MLSNIGIPTLILIVIVALLLFGPNKLPELGRAFGRTLKEFKQGAKDIMDDDDHHVNETAARKEVGPQQVQHAEAKVVDADRPQDSSGEDKNRRLPD